MMISTPDPTNILQRHLSCLCSWSQRCVFSCASSSGNNVPGEQRQRQEDPLSFQWTLHYLSTLLAPVRRCPSSSLSVQLGFPGGSDGRESPDDAGDLGLIPGLGRSSGEAHSKLLRYSCLENPMDRGAWWARVHGVAKSWTRLSD